MLRLHHPGRRTDAAMLSWPFYAIRYDNDAGGNGGTWSGYQAVKHIFPGPDWKNDVITPNWKFITDVRAGKLANFTWITPQCAESDHTECGGLYGPSWVSAIVNTVGRASSGTRRRSSSSGTIGAVITITSRPRLKTTTASAFAYRFW